jgi:hypothetical protein
VSDKLEQIQILFQKRNARKRGPTSSAQYNDTIEEIAHDLAAFHDQWNNRLVPLVASLSSGTEGSPGSYVDAFTDGLDGTTLFVDSTSSVTENSKYFSTPASRPRTVIEQFQDVYTSITSLEESLQNQISGQLLSADQVPVTDAGGLFNETNVEDVLSEIKNQLDTLSSSALKIRPYLQVRRTVDASITPSAIHNIFSTTDTGGTVIADNSSGITWNDSTGKATINESGVYEITVVGLFHTAATGGIMDTYNIEIDDVVSYSAQPYISISADPVERTINIIRSLSTGNVVECNADSPSTDTLTHIVGSTMSIKKIA